MKRLRRILSVLPVIGLFVLGIHSNLQGGGLEPQPGTESVSERRPVSYSWPHGDDNERLKKALKDASIPFSTRADETGREWIEWSQDYDVVIQQIQTELFGEEPPGGRSVTFIGGGKEGFIKWLSFNNISYTIMVHHGDEYVVWNACDSDRVYEYEHFSKVKPYLRPSTQEGKVPQPIC